MTPDIDDPGWTPIAPPWTSGTFIWEKTVVTYIDDIPSYQHKSITGPVRVTGPDGHTPYIGQNGNWWINGQDTGDSAEGDDGHSPYVDDNTGTWWEWDASAVPPAYHDTEIEPQGPQGETGEQGPRGSTPTIGANKYWYIDAVS